jgi:uncharacterized protein YkwD
MADDMVARTFFSHMNPSGAGLLERVERTGYLPRGDDWSLGENLAWGQATLGTPASIVAAWMQSPGHRANVLATDFRDVGIGVTSSSPEPGVSGGTVFVADFGHSVQPRASTRRCRKLHRCS